MHEIGPWLIPALAIIGFVARSIVKVVMDADIRKLELRKSAQLPDAGAASNELEQLRAEIARLRETTTDHALSLQHTVERLYQRVDFLERKSIASQTEDTVTIAPEPRQSQQIVGR
jgi:predicted nuclease with TOPRIM domain